MGIDPKIFKSYDIRGTYPDQVNEAVAYRLGRAFVRYLGARQVVVGRDMRVSSPALHASLLRGITEEGADAIDIGLVTTDMFYFACGSKGLPGITVTASHNPKEYNGFKMVKKLPDLIGGGSGMEELRDLVIGGEFMEPTGTGEVRGADIRSGFAQKVRSLVNERLIAPCRVVVDPANGLGGVAFDTVTAGLPLDVVKLYFEPDGTFPNHGGDPLQSENRQELEKRVVAEKADLGFAFDPDADRFFVIDRMGAFVAGDYLTALLGRYCIEKNGGGTVVYDLRASWAVRDLVERAGGRAVENRVGHAHIKPRMQKEDAVFGGEVTGHYYFRDFYYSDSGVIPALLVLEMLGHYGATIDELIAPIAEVYTISGEINSTVRDADSVLEKIKKSYRSNFEIQELDGVSIIGKDWHANIRKSNTEPLVRLNVEAIKNRALMEEKRDELLELIQE